MNSRLDTLQAALLSVKLDYLDRWVSARRVLAARYQKDLKDIFENSINVSEDAFHLYVIQSENREELVSYLKKKGVATAIHYPLSLPQTKPYQTNILPVAKEVASRVLSLPLYPELTQEEQNYIIEQIKGFYSTR